VNFEDAEIVLGAINIMYEANLKRLNEFEAERIRKQSLMSLGDAFRFADRDDASPFPIADQIRPRHCRGCGWKKPQFLFRWRANQTFSDKCMDCEAGDEWRNSKRSESG
jgi:hypothetical protein